MACERVKPTYLKLIHVLLKRNIKIWTHKQYPYLAFIHDPLAPYFFKSAILKEIERACTQRISIYEYTIVKNALTSILNVHKIKHNRCRIGGSLLLCGTEYCQHSLNAIIVLSY